jgi:hypothetical protein
LPELRLIVNFFFHFFSLFLFERSHSGKAAGIGPELTRAEGHRPPAQPAATKTRMQGEAGAGIIGRGMFGREMGNRLRLSLDFIPLPNIPLPIHSIFNLLHYNNFQ